MKDLCALLDAHADAEHFRRAFGSNDAGGVCVFYDAVVSGMATGRPLFEVDVMTPHVVKYYNAGNAGARLEPPHDGDSPNPVNFLTVAQGTRFAFAVGLRRTVSRTDRPEAEAARSKAVEWMKAALYELGVGSKTAAGYGVFRIG